MVGMDHQDDLITDERLGAALRAIAMAAPRDRANSEASFDFYAKTLIRWAEDPNLLARFENRSPTRIKILVSPSGVIDGLIEHLCELVSGECPTSVLDPFDTNDIVGRIADLAMDSDRKIGESQARIQGQIEGLAWVLARANPWPSKTD
jgi:hypothetical protein